MESAFYDEYVSVEDVHWWFQGRKKILPSLIRPFIRVPSTVLDVGCGGGAIAESLKQFGDVTACDIEERCERAVLRRGGISFVYSGADQLNFADDSFDLVTAFDVVEHLPHDVAALRELARVARPRGRIAIAVPAYQWMWGRQDEINGHYRRYTAAGLTSALHAADLRVLRMTYFNTLLFPPAAVVRLFRRILPTGDQPPVSDFTMTPPGAINDVLGTVFAAEAPILARMRLPFGISLFACCESTA